jgi:hypothetical protein
MEITAVLAMLCMSDGVDFSIVTDKNYLKLNVNKEE